MLNKMEPSEIKKAYDKAAKDYERLALSDGYIAYKKLAKLILRYYRKDKAKVLDLGCGTGLSSIEFFKKGFEITGNDISDEMLKQAKKYPYKKLICQDTEKPLKVKDNEFDIVVLAGVMEFIKDPLSLFKEVKKKMKEDGIFGLTVPKKYPEGSLLREKLERKSYSKKEIEEIFEKAGLKVLERKEIFGYYKEINGKKEKSKFYCYVLKNQK